MGYKILLIEDNLQMAENVLSILELVHYDVLHASNGRVGVDMAMTHLPDLILCDIMMPELDGYGVIHVLKNDGRTSGIPFVFLTAKVGRGDFRIGMDYGADDYITKPFEGKDLLRIIKARLKKSDLIKKKSNP